MVTWSRAGLWGDRGEDATSNYSDRGMNAALEVKIAPCGRRVVDCSKCSDVVCSIKYGARERSRPAWRSLALLCCRCCRLTTARSQGTEYFRSPTDRRDAERHLGCQLQSAEGRVRRLSQRRDLHPGGTNCPYFRKLSMCPGRRNRCTKFRLLRDPKAAREFAGGTFRLATVDEFPASKTMSGGLMIINKGRQRDLHWHVNANEWQYYLRGKGQVVLFGSDGRSKVAEWGRAARSTCPPDSGTPSRTPAMTISRSCRPGTTVNLKRST